MCKYVFGMRIGIGYNLINDLLTYWWQNLSSEDIVLNVLGVLLMIHVIT